MSDLVQNNKRYMEAPTTETVDDLQSQGIISNLSDNTRKKLHGKAVEFAKEVSTLSPFSPEFRERVDAVMNLAEKETASTGAGAATLLAKRTNTQKNAGEASAKAHETLSELSLAVQELSGDKKILGFLPVPFRRRLQRIMQQNDTAQEKLDKIEQALLDSVTELKYDSAAMEVEQDYMKDNLAKMHEYVQLTSEMDAELVAQIGALRADGRDGEANAIETTMLFAVRRRKQDLMTQMAVGAQAFMSMDFIRANNEELARGVQRAHASTLQVLRNSMAIATALETQRKTIDMLDTIDGQANELLVANAKQMQGQAARIGQRAINSGITPEALDASFQAVFDTHKQMVELRAKAVPELDNRMKALENVLTKVGEKRQQLMIEAIEEDPIQAEKARRAITID